MKKLINKVTSWALNKGILDYKNRNKQMEKVKEEVKELEDELSILNDTNVDYETKCIALDNAKMELGDCLITLIILARDLGVKPSECLNRAYNKIKDRKGKTIDGTFVKSEDL